MTLSPFAEFKAAIDFDKFNYDLSSSVSITAEELEETFTAKEWSVVCRLVAGSTVALLQQYHQWLAEKLEQ